MKHLKSLCFSMRLVSTWMGADRGVTSFSSQPRLMSQASEGAIKQHVLPYLRMVWPHTVQYIPSLGHTTPKKLFIFLDRLHTAWVPENKRGLERPHLPHYVIMWDNVNFHLGPLMTWFTTQDAHGATTTILSSGRLISFFPLVVECMNIGAQDQRSLLHAIDKACKEITGDQCRGWLRHLCHFFPCWIARENMHCDVENMHCDVATKQGARANVLGDVRTICTLQICGLPQQQRNYINSFYNLTAIAVLRVFYAYLCKVTERKSKVKLSLLMDKYTFTFTKDK